LLSVLVSDNQKAFHFAIKKKCRDSAQLKINERKIFLSVHKDSRIGTN